MANAFYTQGLQAIGAGLIDLTVDAVYVQAVDSADYTPNMTADNELADIPVAARVGNPAQILNQSLVNAVFDGDDTVLVSVSGDQFEYLALYVSKGSPVVTYLLILIDTASNLPMTPSGGNITVQWSNGANKIFKLGPA